MSDRRRLAYTIIAPHFDLSAARTPLIDPEQGRHPPARAFSPSRLPHRHFRS